MKFRVFAILTCIILILSVTFVACSKQESGEDDSDTEASVSSEATSDGETESETESDTELEIGDSNEAQGDREEQETTKEYLDYYKQITDDKIMHVTFGE